MNEDAQKHTSPGKKEAGQAVTAASILTPHTKQLAAGYIPRRQQPEPSYLDRKVRTLQASQHVMSLMSQYLASRGSPFFAAQMPCLLQLMLSLYESVHIWVFEHYNDALEKKPPALQINLAGQLISSQLTNASISKWMSGPPLR